MIKFRLSERTADYWNLSHRAVGVSETFSPNGRFFLNHSETSHLYRPYFLSTSYYKCVNTTRIINPQLSLLLSLPVPHLSQTQKQTSTSCLACACWDWQWWLGVKIELRASFLLFFLTGDFSGSRGLFMSLMKLLVLFPISASSDSFAAAVAYLFFFAAVAAALAFCCFSSSTAHFSSAAFAFISSLAFCASPFSCLERSAATSFSFLAALFQCLYEHGRRQWFLLQQRRLGLSPRWCW